jgi:hypothetical protein
MFAFSRRHENEGADRMQISESQMGRQSLEQFGQEVVSLLKQSNFRAIAQRFGYALAHGREPAGAIEADLIASLSGGDEFPGDIAASTEVKYFSADATESWGLAAAVECITHVAGGEAVLIALVVTQKGSDRYITLEGVDRVR